MQGFAPLNAVLRAIYPPHCLGCDALVLEDFSFCPACWAKAPLIFGLVCDQCGLPLPGGQDGPEVLRPLCDQCLRCPPIWHQARAALLYDGLAREMILRLKHSDQGALAIPLGRWMAKAGAPLLAQSDLIAPIPLHWWRELRRKENQSALLAQQIAKLSGLPLERRLLQRHRATPPQEGRDRLARAENLAGAFRLRPKFAPALQGRRVLLIDDVLTSGATMAEASRVLLDHGAARVHVLVAARVAPKP